MKNSIWISLCTLPLLVVGCATRVEDSPVLDTAPIVEERPLAISPMVQTDQWAVKWWGPRHQEKLSLIAMGGVDLLMIGDSITHSWEKGGAPVWNEFYSDRNAANIGFSGDRTENVLWRLQNGEIDGISPRLAVLMIGTNNTGHRQDAAADTALGITHIIKELRSRLPETKILLLAVFPRGETPEDPLRKINDQINSLLPRLADHEYIYYLDINAAFLDAEGKLSREIMPDLLHPNLRGYRLWAEAMEPMISELMGE